MDNVERVKELAFRVLKRPAAVGVLSTGEMCAVALLHNNPDYLPGGYTFLDAARRIQGDLLEPCFEADVQGWRP